MYDRGPMNATDRTPRASDARTAATTWRLQQFGGRARDVQDPLIEPLWQGLRVLALVDGGEVTIRDLDGDPIVEFDDIAAELSAASRAERLVVEAYLTHQPVQDLTTIASRERRAAEKSPSLREMWLGSIGRDRKRQGLPPVESLGREPVSPAGDVAIVVVDLLWLDDEPLLDVPLLERKRILESVLEESRLVRRGIFVRPPVDTWLGSWRAFGFTRLCFKAANSRYTPGATNLQWAIAEVPVR